MRFISVFILALLADSAYSQVEPVDKNDSGLYIGGQVRGGQSYRPGGGGSAGAAFGGGFEVGYVMPRDTWNRVEVGAEFLLTEYNFSVDDRFLDEVDIKVSKSPSFLVKFGYGYSLGQHTFGVFRVGAGLARADVELGDLTSEATGIQGMLGYDFVLPAADIFDFVTGVDFRAQQYDIDDINGRPVDDLNVSVLSLYAAARFSF